MPHRIARERRGGWVLLGLLLVLGSPGLAGAQEDEAQEADVAPEEPEPPRELAPPEEEATLLEAPLEQEEPPMEAPVLLPMEEPQVPAAPPPAAPPKPKSERQRGPVELMGLGPALFHLQLGGPFRGVSLTQPAIAIESRSITPWSEHFATERMASLVFHDFQTVSDVYGWYFEEDEYREMKLLYLWPGLILAPLAGSNLSWGAGLVWFSHPTGPSVSMHVGAHATLFLRPSTPQFIADVGLGVYAGVGLDLSESVSLGVRVSYTPPLFHGLASQGQASSWTSVATLNLRSK
jgi:hypothetical protein